jgi:hypothetical protein
MDAFVSVYVDMAARAGEAVTDTFGCRVAVDLTGTFDEEAEGLTIARDYASGLSEALGLPAFAFHDLLRRDYPAS